MFICKPDLSQRVDSVKEENLKLRSENQVLGQYIENLMSASSVFQSTNATTKKKWTNGSTNERNGSNWPDIFQDSAKDSIFMNALIHNLSKINSQVLLLVRSNWFLFIYQFHSYSNEFLRYSTFFFLLLSNYFAFCRIV